MKIMAVCNQKGGVGKTSTAITLASLIALDGYKTLLIDLDPQGNATSGLGVDKRSLEMSSYDLLIDHSKAQDATKSTQVDNLFIIPSNIDLTGAEIELVNIIGRESKLKKALANLNTEYEFAFIDCPPSLGLLTINALTSADIRLYRYNNGWNRLVTKVTGTDNTYVNFDADIPGFSSFAIGSSSGGGDAFAIIDAIRGFYAGTSSLAAFDIIDLIRAFYGG